MEDVIQIILVLTWYMIPVSTDVELKSFYRHPYGVKMCDSWCQQYNTTCVDTMYAFDDLTCCVQLKQEDKNGRKFRKTLIEQKGNLTKDFEIKVVKAADVTDFTKANRTCKERSGRLAKIDSQEKQDMAIKLMKSKGHQFVIIGVYKVNGVFCFIDGTPLIYSAWFTSFKPRPEQFSEGMVVTISSSLGYIRTVMKLRGSIFSMGTVLCEILN